MSLLVGSPLFDEEWYSLCAGSPMGRREAVEHYLATGRTEGLTPHPLFVPEWCARQLGIGEVRDPLVVYLRRAAFEVPTHPLLDTAAYVADHPESLEHPAGPVGHYLEVGAAAGARPNDWYLPDPAAQPRGLVDWLWEDARRARERQAPALPAPTPTAPAYAPDDEVPQGSAAGAFSVLLVAERDPALLRASVESLLAQTSGDWEVLVLRVRGGLDPRVADLPQDPRVRHLDAVHPDRWAALDGGLAAAGGDWVAWMVEGDTWAPGRLGSVGHALAESGASWLHDCATDPRRTPRQHPARRLTVERLEAGAEIEPGTIVVSRELARDLGGFDPALPSGRLLDLVLRLLDRDPGAFLARPGVVTSGGRSRLTTVGPAGRRPFVDHDRLASAGDPVLNERLVDWAALAADPGLADVVSVLVPTHHDWEMTQRAVERVVESRGPGPRVEVVVIDNGCPLVTSAVLSSLAARHEDVTLVHSPVNRGFALGNNLGLAAARGSTVVFLNNDTEVQPGWLEPLLTALGDPEVLAAQSLLLYPTGAVQSAGVVFPRGGGLPHELLQGFPTEDAAGLDEEPLHALTGAALAVRRADVVALHGFDPVFRNGMEDVDLCLRLAEQRTGRFVVRPDSRVLHHESRSPGRFQHSVDNRRVFIERWAGRLPEDDARVWRGRGFEVVGHEVQHPVAKDQRLSAPRPVLTRVQVVREGRPSLRWAIKCAAPFGPTTERWGDTHFARQLAAGLRSLGQDVVIDHRGEFERRTGWHDEVVLNLRGLVPYGPLLDRVNLLWVISHPESLTPFEQTGYDRVYVASSTYAAQLTGEWGREVVPLLQATDPSVFHPDLAAPDTGHRLLFVGNSRKTERPLVTAAARADLPLSVYGQDWEGLVEDRFVRGAYLPNAELGAAYRAAGVVLNDHWDDMRSLGFVSNRLFDAVASGARVVTDEVSGLAGVFGDGVQVAGTPDDLVRLVTAPDLDAVFGDDRQRRERARAVAEQHSFAARAGVLLDDAVRVRAERGLR